jgi:hypothetical protein
MANDKIDLSDQTVFSLLLDVEPSVLKSLCLSSDRFTKVCNDASFREAYSKKWSIVTHLPHGDIVNFRGKIAECIINHLDRLNNEYPKWKCNYYLDTFDYGEKTALNSFNKPNYYPNGYSIDKLFVAAILRSINVIQSLEEICNQIKNQCPNYEWLEYMYLEYGNMDPAEQKLIDDYTSYGYISTNNRLRHGGYNVPAKLNPIINRLRPIPNEIMVFRYFGEDLTKSNYSSSNKEVEVRGYLSTSLDSNLAAGVAKKGSKMMMRIKVPAGARGFYIPGREKEIIFPHMTRLRILGTSEVTIPNIGSDGHTDFTQKKAIEIYDVEMLI